MGRLNSVLLFGLLGAASCLLLAQQAAGNVSPKPSDESTKQDKPPPSGDGKPSDSGADIAEDPSKGTKGPSADKGQGSQPNKAVLPPSGDLKNTDEQGTVAPSPRPELPGYSLYNGSVLCFRASFHAKLIVTYYTKDLIQTNVLSTNLDVPDKAEVDGKCGRQTTTFSLSWAGGNYTLTIDFQQKTEQSKSLSAVTISTWNSNSIAFTFNAGGNNPDFKHITSPETYTVQPEKDDVHFEAPANFSYSCTTEEDITLYDMKNGTKDQSVIESVDLSVWDVKIQAFEVPQNGVFSDSASCKPDADKNIPQQNIVPIIVASCLAAVILIIVIAYYFIKNRADTQYNPME